MILAVLASSALNTFGACSCKQLGREIRGDDLDHVGQLGEFRAEPGPAGADFQDPAAEFQPALFGQEGNELGQFRLHLPKPVVAEFRLHAGRRFALRQQPLVRVTRQVGFLLDVSGLGLVHGTSGSLWAGLAGRKGLLLAYFSSAARKAMILVTQSLTGSWAVGSSISGLAGGSYGALTPVNSLILPARALA